MGKIYINLCLINGITKRFLGYKSVYSVIYLNLIHFHVFLTFFFFKQAIRTTIRYHLGTVAFGSLIIAIIKTIRTVLAYIQRQAKKSKNKVLEYIMMCLQCFMWCLEKIMKFINKHAYIITAIYGHGFCRSAGKAFWLLLR